MIVYEGDIITCNEAMDVHSYLVEDDGLIIYVGDNLPDIYQKCEKVLLEERALLPSFVDSHIHFSSFALFDGSLDLRHVVNFDHLEKVLVSYYNEHKPKVLLAFGISPHSVKEKTLVTKERLDQMPIDCPIMLIKYDGHASVINTKMLNKLPGNIKDLRGYEESTGQLFQEAYFAATDYVTSKVSIVQLLKNMIAGVDKMATYGISMLHTVEGVGFALDLDVKLSKLFAKGLMNPFNLRIFFQTMNVTKALKLDFPRIGGCFETALDGCFGSADAALIEPYEGTMNHGVLFYTDKQVESFVSKAHEEGLQISMHAIGDGAFEQALVAYENVLKAYPKTDHRHTIIHGCLVTNEQMKRAGDIGLHLSVQPSFIHWDLEPYAYLESLIGLRAKYLNPLKSMLKSGITISGGSDGPCTVPDPIQGIYQACNHYNESESLNIEEALRMYTYYGAYGTFDEKERGSLELGKIADMIILNKNPLEIDSKDLDKLKVEQLMLKGRPYKKGQTLIKLLIKGIFG